ncbi:MAG: GAF domain-containing protein [Lachnospiraceae bacterium]|nr:GAF domain-containing protein [Lachnospiraceae bacterium]
MDYQLMNEQLKALCEDVPYGITNMANASALLFEHLDEINWAGFYLMKDGKLILGPFQGKTACTMIPLGRGVCGTAAEKDETQLVYDVHEFPGHIACDSASNSEIVVPLHNAKGEVIGVMDIDSTAIGRFSEEDRKGLETFSKILEAFLIS